MNNMRKDFISLCPVNYRQKTGSDGKERKKF